MIDQDTATDEDSPLDDDGAIDNAEEDGAHKSAKKTAPSAIKKILDEYFSIHALIQGLIISALILTILITYAHMNGEKAAENLKESLGTYTVTIENLNYGKPNYEEEFLMGLNNEAPETLERTTPTDIETIQAPQETNDDNTIDSAPLYPAPIRGLFERTDTGPLPVISDNKVTPFEAYKKPFEKTDRPIIAVGILDFGLNQSISEEILTALSNNFTLLVSPYAQSSKKWQDAARENGFETWMMIPTENDDMARQDPGATAIISQISPRENRDTMHWLLSRAAGYAGVALKTDHVTNRSQTIKELFINEIFKRGLGFFEINPKAPLAMKRIATASDYNFILNEISLNEISLRSLEKQAHTQGHVIGVIKPHKKSIEALITWSKTLESKGIDIAPLSATIKARHN